MLISLAVALTFFTPSSDACPEGCGPCGASQTPVVEVALVNTLGDTLARKAAGLPGAPDTIYFSGQGGELGVYVVSRKAQSPWSCPSNIVVPAAVSVEPVAVEEGADAVYFFDVAGRKVTPKARGVYFMRRLKAGRVVSLKAVVVR